VFNYFDARTCHIEPTSEDTQEIEAPVLCILRDVTAAHRAEEEIAAARRQKRTRHGRQNALSRQCQSRASHAA